MKLSTKNKESEKEEGREERKRKGILFTQSIFIKSKKKNEMG